MKTISQTLFAALLLICMTTVLSGCHSSKKIATSDSYSGRASSWTTLYAPVNVTVDKPMSAGFSGRATMERDKYIHVSMRFIGMEVAAMYIDTDSVCFVDKYHKYVFAESLDNLLGSKYSYLTIGDIQQIILGQKSIPDAEGLNVTATKYVDTPAGSVASELSIEATTPQVTVDAFLSWNPADAQWNDPTKTISFKVPSNYRRITLSTLKSYLKNLSF